MALSLCDVNVHILTLTQWERSPSKTVCTRLALPGGIKAMQLTCLTLTPCPARMLPGRVSIWGREHTVHTNSCPHEFLSIAWSSTYLACPELLSKGKLCQVNLVAHGLCHVFELNQLPWPLVIESITNVPTKTPTYRHKVGQSLMRWLTWNSAQCTNSK